MIVRTALATAFALGTMTSVALAGDPIALTDAQLDGITAGQDFELEFDEFDIDVDQENDSTVLQGGIVNGDGSISNSATVTQVNASSISDLLDVVALADQD